MSNNDLFTQIHIKRQYNSNDTFQGNVHGPLKGDGTQMETFSALLALCAGNSQVTGEFPTQRPVSRSFNIYLFICAWMNRWVNNREAGDLRRHRAHYDVILMNPAKSGFRNHIKMDVITYQYPCGGWSSELTDYPMGIVPVIWMLNI